MVETLQPRDDDVTHQNAQVTGVMLPEPGSWKDSTKYLVAAAASFTHNPGIEL